MIPNTRTLYHVSPIFGNMQGFSVGDFPTGYNTPVKILAETNAPSTSIVYQHGGNAVEILPSFTDGTTACDISVQGPTGATIKTFTQVSSLNADTLYVGGGADPFLLAGDPITVSVANFTGTGSVTIYSRKLS